VARARNRKGRAIQLFVNGKRADDQYALFARVGRTISASEEAARLALAETSTQMIPVTEAAIARTYNVPGNRIAGRLRVRNTRTSITLYAFQRRIPLAEFGGQWGGRGTPGASAEVVRGQRRTYPSAFMAPGRIEGRKVDLIYQRVGPKREQKHGRYKGKKRQGIKHLWGPSVRDMIHGRIPDPITRGSGLRGPFLRAEITEQLADFHVTAVWKSLRRSLSRGD
jgi:hypothetical protein